MNAEKIADASHLEAAPSSDEKIEGKQLLTLAKDASEYEHQLTPLEALKAYPMAVFWSVMVSMCVVMEGYDTILIGNFYAYPTFQVKYGSFFQSLNKGAGGYQVSAPWQAGLGNASGVGAFFGVLANGWLVQRFGQKRTILASLVVLTGCIFITFFAPSIGVLTAGEVLCGLPWGVFASSAPAYASEVLPLPLRVYLTSYTNMCFIIGQLIAAGVLEGFVGYTTSWGYRVPFALQWFWPAFLIPVLVFSPESPWHLVRKGRLEEAEASLRRLQKKSANIDPKQTLASIVHTNNLEKELSTGTSYKDCFVGTERRRTEIACMAFIGQITCGICFAYNSTYFFEQVGLSTGQTYKLNVGGTAMALVGTLVNWFAVTPYVGRRTTYLWGMAAMTLILFIIGLLNIRTSENSVATAQAVLTLIWTFVFQLSVGQLGWSLPAEVGSTRLRQKTVGLARNAYYIAGVIGNVLEPYFINPTQWDLKGYVGFVWGGTALLTFIWAYFRLPETKDRTFDELDVLFAKKLPANKFKGYEVNTFDDQEIARVAQGIN